MEAAGNPHLFMQGSSRDGGIKVKEELVEPSLEVKREPDITPKLEYSLPVSPDPNNYRWGSQEIWNKGE